jgi:hypothetical protein
MLKNYQKSFKNHWSKKEFDRQIALVKELILTEVKDAIIEPPVVENKQYCHLSENVKCFGKSYISKILIGDKVIGHLEYFKSNNNDFFDFNIRP